MVQVVIIESQGLVRAAIRQVIASEPGLEVAGLATAGAEGLALIQATGAHVAVLGPGADDAPDLVRQIRRVAPPTSVLVLGRSTREEEVVAALAAGASGYLPVSATAAELIQSLRTVIGGGAWIHPAATPALLGWLRRHASPYGAAALTPRERSVLALLGAGCSNHEIAGRLGLTEYGVRKHLVSIYRKLGVHNRTQAATLGLHLAAGP